MNRAVLISAAADSPTEKRAICCASMMFTVPSAFTSPCAATNVASRTLRPTVARAICCASMMFTAESPVTSPHLPEGATQTSRFRTRSCARMFAPTSEPATVGEKAMVVPPVVTLVVNQAVPMLAVAVVPRASKMPSVMLPDAALVVFTVSAPKAPDRTESSVRRAGPKSMPVVREARLPPAAAAMSMMTGIPTLAPGATWIRPPAVPVLSRIDCAPAVEPEVTAIARDAAVARTRERRRGNITERVMGRGAKRRESNVWRLG